MAVRPSPAIIRKIEALIDSPHRESKGGSVVEADFKTAYIAAVKGFVDLRADRPGEAEVCRRCNVWRGARHHRRRYSRNSAWSTGDSRRDQSAVSGNESRADSAAPARLAGGGGRQPLRRGPGHRWRCRPHWRSGRGWQSLVDAHKCYAVLLEWLLKRKQWPGAITRAFNTTGMLDRIAKAYGRELIEHGSGLQVRGWKSCSAASRC